ncbi:hypothetical protein [Tsukamurella paurometabola]|uniref:DUF4333 domain-containing protein n=1 Tax=Tsukamurella paurometabola TaxID=2061 RepID=A0A3P8MAW1_TSUPA|nr:hypothetical protein [Tsukamurella paurometabola]UEA81652.1 hypothetical protein LK411_14745 [Tsukamurella paurometabola]VDR38660.1 Uncharacterised protein [Tsukamurella paurometabola]
MNTPYSPLRVVAIAASAVILAGCGGIGPDTIENPTGSVSTDASGAKIVTRAVIEAETVNEFDKAINMRFDSIRCPHDLPAQIGARMVCDVTYGKDRYSARIGIIRLNPSTPTAPQTATWAATINDGAGH